MSETRYALAEADGRLSASQAHVPSHVVGSAAMSAAMSVPSSTPTMLAATQSSSAWASTGSVASAPVQPPPPPYGSIGPVRPSGSSSSRVPFFRLSEADMNVSSGTPGSLMLSAPGLAPPSSSSMAPASGGVASGYSPMLSNSHYGSGLDSGGVGGGTPGLATLGTSGPGTSASHGRGTAQGGDSETAALLQHLRLVHEQLQGIVATISPLGESSDLSNFNVIAKGCQCVTDAAIQQWGSMYPQTAAKMLTAPITRIRACTSELAELLNQWNTAGTLASKMRDARDVAPVNRLFHTLNAYTMELAQAANAAGASDTPAGGQSDGRLPGAASLARNNSMPLDSLKPPTAADARSVSAYTSLAPPTAAGGTPHTGLGTAPGILGHGGFSGAGGAGAAAGAGGGGRVPGSSGSPSTYSSLLADASTGTYAMLFSASRTIEDVDGREFWVRRFGDGNPSIPWLQFVSSLETHVRRKLSPQEHEYLKMSLDHAGCRVVDAYKFAEWLKGFGPTISTALAQMSAALQETWFHGFLSFDEAIEVLRLAAPGTFLVRFSQSSVCGFALAFVTSEHTVQQVLITATPQKGFVIEDRAYSSLDALVKAHSHILLRPAPNALRKCNYFHGFLTFGETTQLLASKPAGAFLLRFSRSQPGSLVVAFVSSNGAVQQSLIYPKPESGGYLLGDRIYSSLDEVVAVNSDKLVTPCEANSGPLPELPAPPLHIIPNVPASSETSVYGSLGPALRGPPRSSNYVSVLGAPPSTTAPLAPSSSSTTGMPPPSISAGGMHASSHHHGAGGGGFHAGGGTPGMWSHAGGLVMPVTPASLTPGDTAGLDDCEYTGIPDNDEVLLAAKKANIPMPGLGSSCTAAATATPPLPSASGGTRSTSTGWSAPAPALASVAGSGAAGTTSATPTTTQHGACTAAPLARQASHGSRVSAGSHGSSVGSAAPTPVSSGSSSAPTPTSTPVPPSAVDRKRSVEDPTICQICFERERRVILVPCGHTFCKGCAEALHECAFCRKPKTAIHAFYLT